MSGAWLLCPDCFYPMHYQSGDKWKCFVCIYVKAEPRPMPSIKWEYPDQRVSDAPTLGAVPVRDEDEDSDELWD